jgi:Ca-activated chloride channel homolog
MRKLGERARLSAILRGLAILAAALAAAGFSLPLPTRGRSVVALIDASDSMGVESVEASRRAALSLIGGLEGRDRVGVVAFAGRPIVVAPLDSPERTADALEAASLELPSTGSTDLSSAVAAASALAASGPGAAFVYLFSDGRSTAGGPPAGASVLRSGVVVNVVAAGAPAAGLVSEGLAVPELARPGEPTLVRWRLRSDSARAVDYALSVDGRVVRRSRASLSAGENELRLEVDAGDGGRRRIEVEASLGGQPLAEAQAGAFLEVGGAGRVIVASGDPGRARSPVAAALAAQGMAVEAGDARVLPDSGTGYADCSAVVLDDVSALAMTEGQQSALQDFVGGGGGLLVVGGESSLGRGEYYATPLEEMLPVETDTRQRLLFTRAKLLFVIDHSGSMSDNVGSVTKQLAAMRGVMAAIPELNPMDEVGIMSFDSSPSWDLPFTPVGERARIQAAITGLSEGGGTDLSVAIEEMLRGFGEPGPTKRHAIILTDGLTPTADFRGLANRLNAAGVTVSTIGIGEEVNEELLRNIADWCGGKYYRARLDQIPKVIDKETVRMTRDLIVEGRIETRIVSSSPVVEGFGPALPPVSGYLVTKAKDRATVLIEASSAGASGKWDPLLATRRYGAGSVAVFASDSGSRWLSAWAGRDAYNRLWAQALRSVERSSADRGLRASAAAEGGSARFIVEAIGEDGRSLSGLRLVGRSTDEGSAPFALEETAPGRYEGFAPLSGPGLRGFEIRDPVSGSWTSAWAWNPPGAELSRLGPDRAALSLIADGTGGRAYALDGVALPRPVVAWRKLPLRAALLALSLFLLLADLYVRSTMLGQLRAARAAVKAWWDRQRSSAESIRSLQWGASPREAAGAMGDERRYEETRRKLAEHVSRRAALSRDGEASDARRED